MSRHIKKIKEILFNKGYNQKEIDRIEYEMAKYKGESNIAIYNPENIGIMNSTKDLFFATVAINEVFSNKAALKIAETIVKLGFKQVIFSSIAFGWKDIVEYLKILDPKIKIKFTWHGSHAMLVQRNETYFLYNILELLDRKIVDSIAFAKESMALYYKEKGYNAYFLPNSLDISNMKIPNYDELKIKGKLNFGLYSAGNRWEKNTFNQLSAISMIDNSVVDVLPVTDLVKQFCDMSNIKIKDVNLSYLKREELLGRMAQNDVNLYVTFTECSPVTPLESLELGIPCITGNNHHYFKEDETLRRLLVVDSEDDINEIKKKIEIALEKKDEIIQLYKKWKKGYDTRVKAYLETFINS